ncbi:MAG: 16S rRNA (guanine(527)-N(7))-methyltransferase RsmG [Sphingobacteriales bacterium]|jgi:16S rRNA (guanine527-N7)-methyltransferase|nr:16S rRNA (guanine(527)-N(7))-methyltransferase RsmG [Sphingobacteriales bacterium]
MEIISKYFSDFSEKQTTRLSALEGLYKDWNEKINVISRKDIDSLYEKHVLHSLSIAAVFPFQDGTQIVDLGCGGGFPGIPLAIFFPEVHFHLVDSIAKKLKVVEAVAHAVELKNITVQHSRIEDIRDKKFDFVISRAVAPLRDLWKWSKPLIRKNTQIKEEPAPGLICLKGGDLAQEIHESLARPYITPIKEIFEEPFFEEKYILYLPK